MPSLWTLRLAIVGLVVLAVSGAAATGAFSTITASRGTSVSVATDQNALLELRDGYPDSGIIEQDTIGTLTIRFGRHGGDGLNRDVVATLGDETAPATEYAFSIANDGTQPRTIDIEYRLAPDATDGNTSARNAIFAFHVDRGADGTIDNTVEISEHSGDRTASIADVTTTDRIYVTVEFDTRYLGDESDLSGTIRITAGS